MSCDCLEILKQGLIEYSGHLCESPMQNAARISAINDLLLVVIAAKNRSNTPPLTDAELKARETTISNDDYRRLRTWEAWGREQAKPLIDSLIGHAATFPTDWRKFGEIGWSLRKTIPNE